MAAQVDGDVVGAVADGLAHRLGELLTGGRLAVAEPQRSVQVENHGRADAALLEGERAVRHST
jgi:hypothetical protein